MEILDLLSLSCLDSHLLLLDNDHLFLLFVESYSPSAFFHFSSSPLYSIAIAPFLLNGADLQALLNGADLQAGGFLRSLVVNITWF